VTTASQVTPFRAGHVPGAAGWEAPDEQVTAAEAAAGAAVYLADISEFQPDLADAAYLAWSKAIVIRAMYGDAHDDAAWYGGARRADLHAGGVQFLGIYQYIVASQDVTAQADALVKLVGKLARGEVIIGDFEEGSGSQVSRRNTWRNVIRAGLGDTPWIYSGLAFASEHGIAPVDWVAAYQASEPSPAHKLWQFSESYRVPGVGTCDCSVFHGSIAQLAALAHGGTPVPNPAPAPSPAANWTETLVDELPTLASGATGQDVRSVQGLLNARGVSVTVDGSYGPSTRAAVTAFQHAKGLAADGSVGPATWPKLLNR
jgi:Putative peptidoglycan binding domain/Glycosyl hydrolases family 25